MRIMNTCISNKKSVKQTLIKISISIVLIFASFQVTNAQSTNYKYSTSMGTGEFEVIYEQESAIQLVKSNNSKENESIEVITSSIDVVVLRSLKTGDKYVFLYPGDKTWNSGDIISVIYEVHEDYSIVWTDDEIANYMSDNSLLAALPENDELYNAIIVYYHQAD